MNSMSLFVLLILSIAKMAENSQNASFKCEYLPNGCKFEQTYDGIKEFVDEIFVCNGLDKHFDFDAEVLKTCKKEPKSTTKVYFRLSSDKIIDRSVQFFSIDNFLNKINTMIQFGDLNEIKFKNIKGFDLNLQTSFNPSYQVWTLLKFLDARFEFYYNNKLIRSCEDFTRMNLTEPKSVFQLGTIARQANYEFENTRFPNSVCPIFFNNIQAYRITFNLMIKTFYKSSFLKFSSNNKSTPLTGNVKELYMLNNEKIDIDSNLLNENIFKNLRFLWINGEINSIQEGIFKSIKNLRRIDIDIDYFDNLIHKGTKWISSINHDLHVNRSNQTQLELYKNKATVIAVEYMVSNLKVNEVPTILVRDEDFCLFKDFPFDQMVLLLIYELTQKLENLSCTLVWLMKDYHLYHYKNFSFLNINIDTVNFRDRGYFNIFQEGNWTEMIEKCNFEKRIENCESERFEYKSEWSKNDTKEIVILIEFMIIFIIPLVGLFGLITNTFIVYVVSLTENKEYLNAKQYSYMRIASIANALVCFISMFTPMYQCQSSDGIYCSSVYDLVFTQYFRIICVEFISSVLKMLSNFSYLGFLITRSSLIGKNHGKFIQFFSELSIVKFLSVSLILSSLFSIVKIFHYQVNTFDTNLDYPSQFERNYNNIFSSGFEVKSRLISIFNAISDLINYILFIVFNLILDICLIVKLKATLSSRVNNTSSSNNQDVINRAITSVVSYTLFSIVFKVPASIKSVFDSANFNDDLNKVFASTQINYLYEYFCLYCQICPMFELLAYLLFIFSLSCNIFFYFMFDNRFKIGFKIGYSKLFSSRNEHLEYLKNLEETLKKGKKTKKRNKN